MTPLELFYVAAAVPTRPGMTDMLAFPLRDGARLQGGGAGEEGLQAGDVVFHDNPRAMGLEVDRQAGALQWGHRDGAVHLVYVAPRWRRQGVARGLLGAVRRFAGQFGLPQPRFTGRRTALGELWVRSLNEEVPPLLELVPPMTLPQDAHGADRRLLVPDATGPITALVRRGQPHLTKRQVREIVRELCGPSAGVPLQAAPPART